MKVLVVNRMNNLGDTMCQMRGLKEWKEQHPEIKQLHFVSSEYFHVLAALHTDLFDSVRVESFEQIGKDLRKYAKEYDKVIEFEIDWEDAVTGGILKAWTKKTLGFTPSTDKPYWIVTPDEALIGAKQVERLHQFFPKLILMQLEAPSGYVRSFRYEDWERVLDMIPPEIGIVYPGPIDLAFNGKLKPRKNLILLPGYDLGNTAGMFQYGIDYAFLVHGGTAMIAHAVDFKNVMQVYFTDGGSSNLLTVPEWVNFVYKSHAEVDWVTMKKKVRELLA